MVKPLEVGDLRIAYELTGRGPPLLLIHGAEGSRRMFDALVPHLSSHFTTITYDQRDCGETDGSTRAAKLSDLADDAAGLLHGLGFAEADVYGTSFGGRVAQALARRHPHRVRTLVLGSTWPLPQALVDLNPEAIAQIVALRDRLPQSADALAAYFLPEAFLAERPELRGLFRNAPPRSERTMRRSATVADTPSLEPSDISVPTLCIAGSVDRVVPPAITMALADEVPGAERVVLDGVGHAGAVQVPDVIAHHVKRFCLRPIALP